LNPFVSPPIPHPAKLRCGGSTPEVLMAAFSDQLGESGGDPLEVEKAVFVD
jgi:hypothetical protein